MMKLYEPTCAVDVKAGLGENPIWSGNDQALFWLDIHANTVNRFDFTLQSLDAWPLPSLPGCMALAEGTNLIVAVRDGIYNLDYSSGALTLLSKPDYDESRYHFNDGCCDREGRLWAGVYLTTGETDQGYFCRYDGSRITRGVGGVHVPNGCAFSADGKTMFRAESLARKVFALDYDSASGTASNSRLFAEVPSTYGLPDGATVDSDGGYWCALPLGPDGGGVARFKANGELDRYIELPVSQPTMVTFGGPTLSTLYVSSACDPVLPTAEVRGEKSGAIFALETEFTGIPSSRFRSRARVEPVQ